MPALTLYPAIDILGGRCVRPTQGDSCQERVYDENPVAVARHWKGQGAEWLHIVDLDGALDGAPKHLDLVKTIRDATGLSIQFGGGLRTEAAVEAAFAAGVARVVLGTAAAREPELLAGCLARWSARVAVSVDARGGQVTVAGWLEILSESALTFAQRMAQVGVRTLVITNVERDGTLAGGDTTGLAGLRAALPDTHLIAAGSLASLDDLRWLAARLDGAVLGRALYEGALDLAEALRFVRELPDEVPPEVENPPETKALPAAPPATEPQPATAATSQDTQAPAAETQTPEKAEQPPEAEPPLAAVVAPGTAEVLRAAEPTPKAEAAEGAQDTEAPRAE
jgi:phosphoribosylformimino-5-aminoimidazole carboxamide ribotide isomerase